MTIFMQNSVRSLKVIRPPNNKKQGEVYGINKK